MNLREKQTLFKRLFRVLELYAEAMGYELVDGMHWRSSAESKRLKAEGRGISPSLHEMCLAGHLEAFDGDHYLTQTEEFTALGEFWESLHPDTRWGGRFGDGCHFSLAHRGMA